MIDAKAHLDELIAHVTTMTDDDLITVQNLIERAHVHVLIERSLRSGDRMSNTIRSLNTG